MFVKLMEIKSALNEFKKMDSRINRDRVWFMPSFMQQTSYDVALVQAMLNSIVKLRNDYIKHIPGFTKPFW